MPSDIVHAYGAQAADAGLSEHWSGPALMVDALVDEVGVLPGQTVLDVGCGVGGPARRLRRMARCRVVGLDLVLDVLAEARRRSAEDGLALPVAAASATALPIRDAAVDHVWALGVVAHVEDLETFAGEAARVLVPAGAAAITEAFWDGRREPRFAATAPRPWAAATVPQVGDRLDAAGLDVEERPWPGMGIPGALDAADPALRADLEEGRLVPALLVARKPRS